MSDVLPRAARRPSPGPLRRGGREARRCNVGLPGDASPGGQSRGYAGGLGTEVDCVGEFVRVEVADQIATIRLTGGRK